MEIIYYLIFSSLFQTFIESSPNDSISILGNWGYCKDGTYFELYVSDSVIYEISDKIPLLAKEFYRIQDCSLEILNKNKTAKTKTIYIEYISSKHIMFKYDETIKLNLYKIEGCINIPFYDKKDPIKTEMYEMEFMDRAKLFKSEYPCKVNGD